MTFIDFRNEDNVINFAIYFLRDFRGTGMIETGTKHIFIKIQMEI